MIYCVFVYSVKRIVLKYASHKFGYEWITVFEPFGLALQNMDELFHLYDTRITQKYGLKNILETTTLVLPSIHKNYLTGKNLHNSSCFKLRKYLAYPAFISYPPNDALWKDIQLTLKSPLTNFKVAQIT